MTLRYRPVRTIGAPPTNLDRDGLADIRQALAKLDARQGRMLKVLLRSEDRALKRIEAQNAKRWREMLIPVGLSVVGSLIAAYLVGHFRGLRRAIEEGPGDIR